MKAAFTNDPDLVQITFNPMVNDRIEFDSDRQTEKGPSGGCVTQIDYRADECWIEHSDTGHPGERFVISEVKVLGRGRHHKTGRPFWLLM